MMKYTLLRPVSFLSLLLISLLSATAGSLYDWNQCQGSARPYPVPETIALCPDSLTPLMINHVGRHGARYASSPKHTTRLLKALHRADSLSTITPLGRELLALTDSIVSISQGSWGHLDSLGMVEQQEIARRMAQTYPSLFHGTPVEARASYVPRCVMSMDEFTHQLATLHPKTDIATLSGPAYSPLLRFFSKNEAYDQAISATDLQDAYTRFADSRTPVSALRRVLGSDYPLGSDATDLALTEYQVLSGMEAIGLKSRADRFFTLEEYNDLWQIFNLRQYLTHAANRFTSVPATIARPLLRDLITTTDRFLSGDPSVPAVMLRFGHAETLMPLLSLMNLPGCNAPAATPAQVASEWRDFDIVPMAANLQMILLQGPSGTIYLRLLLNERPIPLAPGLPDIIPWSQARSLLQNSLTTPNP